MREKLIQHIQISFQVLEILAPSSPIEAQYRKPATDEGSRPIYLVRASSSSLDQRR